MDRINSLYSGLDRAQKRALKKYLAAFGSPGKEDKQLVFLKLLEKNPGITQEEAILKMYNATSSKAFIMMKSRLYERMTEFLSLSLNPSRDRFDKQMPYFRDLIAYRKEMLTATALQDLRLSKLARPHFENALKLARSCHNAELEADVLMRIRGAFAGQKLAFQEVSEQLHYALEATERDAHAIGVYHIFLHRHSYKTSGSTEMLDYLDRHLPELELRLQQFYSPRADYYVQIMKVHQARIASDYPKGKLAADRAIELIEQYSGLRSRQRYAEPLYQLGVLEIKFQHFPEAIAALTEARGRLKGNSQVYILASTMLLYGYIYAQELAEAEAVMEEIETLQAQPGLIIQQDLADLVSYLASCIAYHKGDYSAAWSRLQQMEALFQDKAGWATGLKFFEILLLVEKGDVEQAEHRTESLRKHIKRHGATTRQQALSRLLRNQARHFFSWREFESEDRLLEEVDAASGWDPLGHELVRVDSWYRNKQQESSGK